jgi:hypothetical protein
MRALLSRIGRLERNGETRVIVVPVWAPGRSDEQVRATAQELARTAGAASRGIARPLPRRWITKGGDGSLGSGNVGLPGQDRMDNPLDIPG